MSRFLTLAGARLSELAELSADEGRFSRGRALFRKGSVADLVIAEGSVTASVRGSGGDLYETTIATAAAPPGVRRQVADGLRDGRGVDELIDDGVAVCPGEIDVVLDCDCPDWDELCKHVVAVLLALADRVDLDETELLRWRGLGSPPGPITSPEAGPPGGAVVPGATPRRTSAPRRPAHSNPAAPSEQPDDQDRAARLARLKSLLGDTSVRVRDEGGPAASAEPSDPVLDPAVAAFLGVGSDIDVPDVGGLVANAPLFSGVEHGPLAQLGPELAAAMLIIADGLAEPGPDR